MIGLICLFLVGILLCLIGVCYKGAWPFAILGGTFLCGSIVGAISLKSKPEPTALDVYRNKTSLQITYIDSIPIDTVVVFKEEFK